MIWHIVKKDFLLNVISARFVIGFILCLLIIPFSIVVNIDDYKNQLRVYQLDKENADKELKEVRVYSALRPVIIKPPEPLGIFCKGISTNMGSKVITNFGEKPVFPQGKSSIRDNPFLNSFFSIDFVCVISILISLLALVFSYDLFTREREDGTMKLALTKGVSRSVFVAGKILGVFVTLLPILVFCYLLSFLVILFTNDVSFSSGEWTNILVLFIISLLFMVVFVLMGTFISSRVRHSSTSIVISLLCWVWFVFLMPNIANFGAESFAKIKQYDNVRYALNELDREYSKLRYEEIYPEILKELGLKHTTWWNANGGNDGYFETTGTPMEVMEFERRMREWGEPVRIDYADKKWAVQKDFFDGMIRQSRVQEYLSWLSPSAIFEQVSAGLCRTDKQAYLDYMDKVRTYREILIRHFKDNKLFESFLYITPQPVDKIVNWEDYNKIANSGNIPDCWSYRNCPPLDLMGVPMFSYKATGLPALINKGLLKMITLLVGGIVMFLLTQWSFGKYDVR